VAAAEDAFGPVSVLINNAGIVRFGPIAEIEPAAWRQVLDINLTGTYLGIRAGEASFSTGSEFIADGGLLLGAVPEARQRA